MPKRSAQAAHSKDQMMFSWMEPDPSAMPMAAKAFLNELRSANNSCIHFLISCGKHKQSTRTRAADLYTSPRFRLSIDLPRRLGVPFSVLSAKHGLLEPDDIIDPYDLSLASLSREERRSWADHVLNQVKGAHSDVRRFIFLADDDYREDLAPLLRQKSYDIVEPLLPFERSGRMSFLRNAHRFLDRERAAKSFYDLIEHFQEAAPLPTLRETVMGSLPAQGVYFFFDPNEQTRFSTLLPRLVRIGTHGVSKGSKATLRDRLRTHLGTSDGNGNHRASVFRLHVGEAIIRRDDLRNRFPNWGKGQSVERSIADSERDLEKRVSTYISQLQLYCVEVADRVTKYSARSRIERLSIALFTERFVPLESSSSKWLGLHSAQDVIVRTGLWNVRDSGGRADFEIAELIANRVRQSPWRSRVDSSMVSNAQSPSALQVAKSSPTS